MKQKWLLQTAGLLFQELLELHGVDLFSPQEYFDKICSNESIPVSLYILQANLFFHKLKKQPQNSTANDNQSLKLVFRQR